MPPTFSFVHVLRSELLYGDGFRMDFGYTCLEKVIINLNRRRRFSLKTTIRLGSMLPLGTGIRVQVLDRLGILFSSVDTLIIVLLSLPACFSFLLIFTFESANLFHLANGGQLFVSLGTHTSTEQDDYSTVNIYIYICF